MAYSIPHNHTKPTGSYSYSDPFGDHSGYNDPFTADHFNHDDAKTFVTNTSGILVGDQTRAISFAGPTEAEALAADYRQHNVTPSFPEQLGGVTPPTSQDGTLFNTSDTMVDISHRDDHSLHHTPSLLEKPEVSLVHNAADMGRSSAYQDLEYAEPSGDDPKPTPEKDALLRGFLGSGKYPIEQRVEDKRRGIGRQKHPFVVYVLTIAMVGIFINELVVNSRAQGTPVSFKPVVNPMLGPSESALISLGARFPPCMKSVQGLSTSTLMPCLNDTANPPTSLCTIEDVCGFGGFQGGVPNQWFRFITAIFLHAGFIHIILNMIAQLTISAQIEREMGSVGFVITYFASGIFGNVLGGNFSLVGAPSLGASGAIFGTVAVTWVDLFAHWKYHYRPGRRLAWMTVELLFGIAIGYIPYIDNFAHLGGLCMGLLVGTTFYPVVSPSARHKSIMWAFRLAAIPLAVVLFVVLIRNFYTSDPYAALHNTSQRVPVVATCLVFLLLRIITVGEPVSPLRVAGLAFSFAWTFLSIYMIHNLV